jgi:IS30 family transposase
VPGTRLTIDEREEIALGVATGRSFADIAAQPGAAHLDSVEGSTARRATDRRACRLNLKVRRLDEHRWLAAEVAKQLKKEHSPEQIANRLRPGLPPPMRSSA